MNTAGEIAAGQRFAFGQNWMRFLDTVDTSSVDAAVASVHDLLGPSLSGVRFLDAGSGSGLFSLAARLLGAEVVSCDLDPSSVTATGELRRRFAPDDLGWQVLRGSVLDTDFIASLGQFDVVYSWGVIHHTGSLYRALDNVASAVAPGGRLVLAVYNDQGGASRRWTAVKRRYNAAGPIGRTVIVTTVDAMFRAREAAVLVRERVAGRDYAPVRARGMNRRRDLLDWVGGWPFEVAKPEQVFDACRHHGLQLERLSTCGGGHGCNEFVFRRPPVPGH